MCKRVAVVSGSFDPITRGHADIIRRAAGMFDRVIVSVTVNAEKGGGMFSPEERLALIQCAVGDIPNVSADICEGLLSEFLKEHGAKYIVRGIRSASDFDYEYSLAEIMKKFDSTVETVFLPAAPTLSHISSSYAKERIRYMCPLDDIADEKTANMIREIREKKDR